MAEKRLAADQVPFTSGGGGASVLQSATNVRALGGPDTDLTGAFVPVGGAGATLINFTLQNDAAVYLVAYGTSKRITNVYSDTVIGIRVDGVTDYTGTRSLGDQPNEYNGLVCALSLNMTSGPHTAEVIFKWGGDAGVGPQGRLESDANGPTRISATWMDPVYGVGSLTKLQSVVAGPPRTTYIHPGIPNYQTFVPVPGSQISFTLPVNQTVFFSGTGTGTGASGGGWTGVEIGLRVDGTDYPGSGAGNLDSFGEDCLNANYALDLVSGPHTAELVIRKSLANPGWHPWSIPEVRTCVDAPLVLNALFTKPEQLYQAETVANPAQIDAGDTGSPGTTTKVSLSDHEHPVNTGLTADIQPTGTANNGGASTKLARADHVHRLLLEGQEEGVAVGFRPKINFIGADVTVADNIGADRLDVTFVSPASDYVGKFEQGAKPTIIQIPDGKWGFWWDTNLSEMWQVRNRGGTMYAVELNPLP
jgi:hypothetical protein